MVTIDKVAALLALIEADSEALTTFHAEGCPPARAEIAKAAFERMARCYAEIERIAFHVEQHA